MEPIAKNIRNLRKSNGLTQAQFGHIVGVKRSTLAVWESGKYEPGMAILKVIAEKFAVPVESLTTDNGNDSEVGDTMRDQSVLPELIQMLKDELKFKNEEMREKNQIIRTLLDKISDPNANS